jgi:hypothetical protein
MQKTYAFMDVIGTKAALAAGRADKLLLAFWQHAESWANRTEVRSDVPYVAVAGTDSQEPPEVQVATVSDSLLLSTVREYTLESFFALAVSLQKYLKIKAELPSYCIVSRGSEVERPAVGYTTYMSSSEHPAYRHLVGAGSAWADMWDADHAIREAQDWRDTYTFYSVGIGESELPQTFKKAGEMTIKSKWGGATASILALQLSPGAAKPALL